MDEDLKWKAITVTRREKSDVFDTKSDFENLQEAQDVIRELLNYIKALENPMRPIETVPLPLNVRQVLIFSQQEGFCVAEIHSDGLNVLSGGKWKKKKASHWAYIPKIPELEDKQ